MNLFNSNEFVELKKKYENDFKNSVLTRWPITLVHVFKPTVLSGIPRGKFGFKLIWGAHFLILSKGTSILKFLDFSQHYKCFQYLFTHTLLFLYNLDL